MTLSATIFFGIGATVLWGGLLTTIIISIKKDRYSDCYHRKS